MKILSIMNYTRNTDDEPQYQKYEDTTSIGLIHLYILIFIFTVLTTSILSGQVSTDSIEINNREELISKLEYDSESGIFYYIENRNGNIHVNLRFMDETLKKKVLIFGLHIYIDLKNKKKKDISIKYPIGSGDMQNPLTRKMWLNKSLDELELQVSQQLQEIELEGFVGKKEISYSYAENQEGIHGNIDFDQIGSMLYELIIPITKVPGLPVNSETQYSLGIETGYLAMNQASPEGTGRGRNGGGGRSGGGKGSGMRGSGQQSGYQMKDSDKMTQPDKLWLKNQQINVNKTDKK